MSIPEIPRRGFARTRPPHRSISSSERSVPTLARSSASCRHDARPRPVRKPPPAAAQTRGRVQRLSRRIDAVVDDANVLGARVRRRAPHARRLHGPPSLTAPPTNFFRSTCAWSRTMARGEPASPGHADSPTAATTSRVTAGERGCDDDATDEDVLARRARSASFRAHRCSSQARRCRNIWRTSAVCGRRRLLKSSRTRPLSWRRRSVPTSARAGGGGAGGVAAAAVRTRQMSLRWSSRRCTGTNRCQRAPPPPRTCAPTSRSASLLRMSRRRRPDAPRRRERSRPSPTPAYESDPVLHGSDGWRRPASLAFACLELARPRKEGVVVVAAT